MKKRIDMPLLLISLDAIEDTLYESMANDPVKYPNISRLMKKGYYQNNIKTLTLSNTHPVHTSVITGKYPFEHGITSDYTLDKKDHRHYQQFHNQINAKTLWSAAKEKNLKTAAFLWPVTCGAKIDHHLPLYHPVQKKQDNHYHFTKNLKYGRKGFQIKSYLKNKKYLKGLSQPNLDNFLCSSLAMLLKKDTPDFVAVHLSAYDAIFHEVGQSNASALEIAKTALDYNIGRILSIWRNKPVLLFSAHAALPVNIPINLNIDYPNRHFFQNGGVAFGKRIDTDAVDQHWFNRYLSKEEMHESGLSGIYAFGIAANPGYAFSDHPVMGEHGYPSDYANYRVFYHYSHELDYDDQLKGDLFDVTYIIARELGLEMDIVRR